MSAVRPRVEFGRLRAAASSDFTTSSFKRSMREAFPLDYEPNALGIEGPPVSQPAPTLVGVFLRLFRIRTFQ